MPDAGLTRRDIGLMSPRFFIISKEKSARIFFRQLFPSEQQL
jgi:hypothetical protein